MTTYVQSKENRDLGAGAPPARGSSRRRAAVTAGAAGVALAVLLGGLGAVMRANADFARENVSRQLGEQRISFKPAEALTPEEQATPCLVKFAGAPLTTGAHAECYANSFIGRHLKSVADGRTFSEMRLVQNALRADIATAQAAGDPAAADLQRQLAEVTGKRQSLFEGETLRGLLMTSYGFSTLGAKAEQAAGVATGAGLVAALAAIGLLGFGARRPKA